MGAALVATMTSLTLAAAPASAQDLPSAQDLSSAYVPDYLPGDIAHTLEQEANRIQRDIQNGIDDALNAIPGSSDMAPHVPPAPSILPWAASAPQPVGAGHNGEIRVGNRSYLIWVPHGYTPARSWPVMVGYSAYQDTTENFRNYSRLRESNVGKDAIIVYPRAIGRSWEGSATSATRPGEDIRFTRQMIDDLQRYYNIDRSRLYATGMSTGGGMAAVAACHMPDLFAGVAGVSGAYYTPVLQGCSNAPVAFMAVHGSADNLTYYHGGHRRGMNYYGVPHMYTHYLGRNNCHGQTVREHHGFTRFSGNNCVKGTEVLRVNGSTHLWWYSNPNTSNEIWAFLSRQRK